MINGVTCGQCSENLLCGGDNICYNPCLGFDNEYGSSEGILCKTCATGLLCNSYNDCYDPCIGFESECGSSEGIVCQTCSEGNYCENRICKPEPDGVDYSTAYNNYGGFYNAPNHPNETAFAALKADGSITAWGNEGTGGTGAPIGTGYSIPYGEQ